MQILLTVILIGVAATAIMDMWCIVRKPLLGVPFPNYALVGRWIAHMPQGRFRHDSIASSQALRLERALGWAFHYLTGIAFAGLLIAIWGKGWLQQPALGPSLTVGISTVAAPFLLMQPGMGAGIAASRTANPASARLQSIVTHAVFGLGLYVSGLLVRFVSLF